MMCLWSVRAESMWLEQRRELVELVANLDPELAVSLVHHFLVTLDSL
mgnify:CR=1 FL=1